MSRPDGTDGIRETSLLELVSAVAEHAADDREVAQIVGHLINHHRFLVTTPAAQASRFDQPAGYWSAPH